MSIRTRNRGSVVGPGVGVWDIKPTGLWGGVAYGPYTQTYADFGQYENTLETMTDTVDGTRNVHAVSHVHTSVQTNSSASSWRLRDLAYGGTMDHSFTCGLGNSFVTSLNPIGVPNGAALAQSRVPLFSKEMVNGLVSIYEVGDMKQAFQAIPVHLLWATFRFVTNLADKRGAWNAAQDYLYDLRKILKLNRGATYAETCMAVLKYLSGLSLAWKFGWKPFLDDIQKARTALGKWQANVESVTGKQYTCVGRHIETATDRTAGQGLNQVGQFRFDATCDRVTQATFVAGVKRQLNPDIPGIDGLQRAVLAESLGLKLNAAKVWEVIPWSFVVDWLIPIGTFLEQFGSVQPGQSRVTDVLKWESVRTTTKLRCSGRVSILHPTTGQYRLDSSNLIDHAATGTKTSYQRTVGGSWSTPPVYIPAPTLPSGFALWTGMELALQRINIAAKRRYDRS